MKKLLLIALISFCAQNLFSQVYCASNATNASDGIIAGVVLNTINNSSATCATYTNNTSISTSISQGLSYPLTVIAGTCGNALIRYGKVFIDYNNNGNFNDPGEEVFAFGPTTGGANTQVFTTNIAVPTTVASGSKRMRIVLVETNSVANVFACGTYFKGETEDYTVNISPVGPFDVGVVSAYAGNNERQIPHGQVNLGFGGRIISLGSNPATNARLTFSVPGTPVSGVAFQGTMTPFTTADLTLPQTLTNPPVGKYNAAFVAQLNEPDAYAPNDSLKVPFEVSDSIFAYDDSTVTGGIGNATPVEFGHTFEIIAPDTITSVSFRLSTPPVGARMDCRLYEWDNINDLPGTLIDSTQVLQIAPNGSGWYTLRLGCGNRILPAGKYFISIYQVNAINMSVSYTRNRTAPENYLYVDLNNGNGFIPSDAPTLNPLVNEISLLLRPNLGKFEQPNIIIGKDRNDQLLYCPSGFPTLRTNNYLSYEWSDGSFRDSLKTLAQGTFSVTVMDALGCVFANTVTTVPRSSPNITTSATAASSCFSNDGVGTVTASNPGAPFTYLWPSGATSNTVNNLSGNSYLVTVTDVFNCQSVVSVDVPGGFPSATAYTQAPTCNGYGNGAILLDNLEGPQPFTYSWSNGATTQNLNNIPAGLYTVTITAAGNCQKVENVILSNPPILRINGDNSINPSSCGANDGEAIAQVSGGVPGYQYLWENGQTVAVRIGLLAGSYKVTVTDNAGCAQTQTIVLEDPNTPQLQTTGSTLTCGDDRNGTTNVVATGGNPPYNFLWSNGQTSQTASNLGFGTYTVQVSDAAGCISFANAAVEGPDPISLSVGINYATECSDEAFINALSGGTPPYTYQWNDPSGSTSSSASNLCNGSYKVVVIDAQGCKDSASVFVFNPSTSIESALNSESWNVYPNPAKSHVFIEVPSSVNLEYIRVFDAKGSEVLRTNDGLLANDKLVQLNLGSIEEGLYFIQMVSDEGLITKPLMLVK